MVSGTLHIGQAGGGPGKKHKTWLVIVNCGRMESGQGLAALNADMIAGLSHIGLIAGTTADVKRPMNATAAAEAPAMRPGGESVTPMPEASQPAVRANAAAKNAGVRPSPVMKGTPATAVKAKAAVITEAEKIETAQPKAPAFERQQYFPASAVSAHAPISSSAG